MRKMGVLLGSFVLGLIAVNLVVGQQFGGFGRFGGGGGGGAGSLTLINNPQVKKELEITDEQLEKVPDAVQKALAEVLNEKQLKRLRQIELQQRGVRAFNDPKVQAQLKITDEQKENIKTIIDDSGKETAELFREAKGAGGFGGIREKMTALDKETSEKVQGVLTADQRKQWKQVIGAEFKLETQGFGGFGGFGGKKKKKADNNE
jgi:hypothetical protein